MEQQRFKCIKCGCTDYIVDEIRTTGGALSKFFDVQNKKFTVISCSRCGYSELYKKTTSTLGNVVDFLAGG